MSVHETVGKALSEDEERRLLDPTITHAAARGDARAAHGDAAWRNPVPSVATDRLLGSNADRGRNQNRGGNLTRDSAERAGTHDSANLGDEFP